jgi:O-acetyl-ADP-ribose deacetylase (regulator of RNase III)
LGDPDRRSLKKPPALIVSKSHPIVADMFSPLLTFVEGDLLDAPERFICHQCNCVMKGTRGLATAMFDRFPYADAYQQRGKKKSTPGTIQICGNGVTQRFVVNMFAQITGGKPKVNDSAARRLSLFRACLGELAKVPDLHSVAFPYLIGCGMAGGNWAQYQAELERFADIVKVPVVLYKLPDAPQGKNDRSK